MRRALTTPAVRSIRSIRWKTWVAGCLIATVAAGVLLRTASRSVQRERAAAQETAERRIPIGVMGDSDSHSYQDGVWFRPGTAERGGAWRAGTFQWTEALARLRGREIDLGAWGVWGTGRTMSRLRGWVGLEAGSPKKEDYRYNVAFSGAHCADLTTGGRAQAPRLVALMDREPRRWRNGAVVIRIGIVELGGAAVLDRLARDPADATVLATIAGCVERIRDAIALVHAHHPLTRIMLVGVLNNADWPPYFDRWQLPRELANITAGLDVFDRSLGTLAAADPRIAFFDDRSWFLRRWGGRGADGRPDYRTVSIGPAFEVIHASGDDPVHSVLGDGHAGLAWNALWAQSLVQRMNAAFGMGIAPISDDEIVRFIQDAAGAAAPLSARSRSPRHCGSGS